MMHPTPIIVSLSATFALLTACGDGAQRRTHGDACDAPTQCQSGICAAMICIDPLSCRDLLPMANPGDDVAMACIEALGEVRIEVVEQTGSTPGAVIQFAAYGTFRSTTLGGGGAGSLGGDAAAPSPAPGGEQSSEEGEEGEEMDDDRPGFADGPLTSPTIAETEPDLTHVAVWTSSDLDALSFEAGAPGRAVVGEAFDGQEVQVFATVTLEDEAVTGELVLASHGGDRPSGEASEPREGDAGEPSAGSEAEEDDDASAELPQPGADN